MHKWARALSKGFKLYSFSSARKATMEEEDTPIEFWGEEIDARLQEFIADEIAKYGGYPWWYEIKEATHEFVQNELMEDIIEHVRSGKSRWRIRVRNEEIATLFDLYEERRERLAGYGPDDDSSYFRHEIDAMIRPLQRTALVPLLDTVDSVLDDNEFPKDLINLVNSYIAQPIPDEEPASDDVESTLPIESFATQSLLRAGIRNPANDDELFMLPQ